MRLAAALAAAVALALAGPPPAAAQAAADPTRGRLLYDTHCKACHSTQMHWRDQRAATDWPSLLAQVRQWQARGRLDWSDADIEAVAGHLNDTIYRWPRPERRAAWTPGAGRP